METCGQVKKSSRQRFSNDSQSLLSVVVKFFFSRRKEVRIQVKSSVGSLFSFESSFQKITRCTPNVYQRNFHVPETDESTLCDACWQEYHGGRKRRLEATETKETTKIKEKKVLYFIWCRKDMRERDTRKTEENENSGTREHNTIHHGGQRGD